MKTPFSPSANLTGALWMIAAMAAFAIEDSFLKAAVNYMPFGQVLVTFGIGGTLLFGALARINKEPLASPDARSKAMLVRAVFEIIGRLFFVLAVVITPLSSATVILQATPLVVVGGAALLFGETVGWRRWTAIGIGLLGVLVIIQPGTDSFSSLSIIAVIGMLGLAGRDLASRAAPVSLSAFVLGFYGFTCVILAGIIFALWEQKPFVVPETTGALLMGCAIFTGIFAYSALMKSLRTGDVSAVTPFRYTRLIFGIALGILIFGETLTSSMILGSALIVLSGLFILWRGRK